MDHFHREVISDTRTAKPCQFCKTADPDFSKRRPLDQFVQETDTAASHITEDGHVRHRILELMGKLPMPSRRVHPAA